MTKQDWLEHFLEMCESSTRANNHYSSCSACMPSNDEKNSWRLALIEMSILGFDINFYGLGDTGYYFTWSDE